MRISNTLFLVLALAGIMDTAYLASVHYLGTTLACPNSGIINCDKVLNSQYADLFGIPLAVYGLVFFILEIGIIYLVRDKDALVIYNGVGMGFVFYFWWIEYTLSAVCIYCTISHALVILLLLLSILRLRGE